MCLHKRRHLQCQHLSQMSPKQRFGNLYYAKALFQTATPDYIVQIIQTLLKQLFRLNCVRRPRPTRTTAIAVPHVMVMYITGKLISR